jgi:hypothetical protein
MDLLSRVYTLNWVSTIRGELHKVFFNTGAHLESIWLNGKRIYHNEAWTGWHAGKERVPAELREGRNTILIETGGEFFLSVTDDDSW